MGKEPDRKSVREIRITKIKQILSDEHSRTNDFNYGILLALTEIIESIPCDSKGLVK